MNGFDGLVDSHSPKCEGAESWPLLVDTNVPGGNPKDGFTFGKIYQVTGRWLLFLAATWRPSDRPRAIKTWLFVEKG